MSWTPTLTIGPSVCKCGHAAASHNVRYPLCEECDECRGYWALTPPKFSPPTSDPSILQQEAEQRGDHLARRLREIASIAGPQWPSETLVQAAALLESRDQRIKEAVMAVLWPGERQGRFTGPIFEWGHETTPTLLEVEEIADEIVAASR